MDTENLLSSAYADWQAGGGLSGSLGMIGDRPTEAATDWSQYTGTSASGFGGAASYTTDSGALQQAAATALGYIGKYIDVDLYKRAMTVQPVLRSTQNGISVRQQTGTVGGLTTSTTSLNLGSLLPLALIGGAAYLLLRK